MKLPLITSLCAILLVFAACSKNEEKNEAPVIDYSILTAIRYWKMDSTQNWANNNRQTINFTSGVSYSYAQFTEEEYSFVEYRNNDWNANNLPYELRNGAIYINNIEDGLLINRLDSTGMVLKVIFTNSSIDSLVNYYSPLTEEEWNNVLL